MLKSPNHIFVGRGGAGGGIGSQLLILSSNLLKSKKKFYKGVG